MPTPEHAAGAEPDPALEDLVLAGCQGFVVRHGRRRLGVVENPLYCTSLERPDGLIVVAGTFRLRRFYVSCDEIRAVLPREKRIELKLDGVALPLSSSARRGRPRGATRSPRKARHADTVERRRRWGPA